MEFFSVLFIAILVEGIIAYTKDIFVNKKISWQTIMAICLGIIVAVGYDLDLLEMVGLTSTIPYLGNVLSGILVSRGSNYMADLIKQIGNLRVNPEK